MQVIVPNRALFAECSGQSVVAIRPELGQRLDAIKQIKDFDDDLRKISNHGRRITRGTGGLDMVRIGSLPLKVCLHIKNTIGMQFFFDPYLQEQFFKANPEWSTIYR